MVSVWRPWIGHERLAEIHDAGALFLLLFAEAGARSWSIRVTVFRRMRAGVRMAGDY